MTAANWDISAYGRLLQEFGSLGYRVVSFAEVQSDHRHLVLRHDVDFDPSLALELAEWEAEHDFRSAYFFLLVSEFYSAFTPTNRKILQCIRALGHEVGLHFDPSAYVHESGPPWSAAVRECELLEEIVGHDVQTVSLHRPPAEVLVGELEIPGRRNTYESRFFQEIGYCSDSRGSWNHGPPRELPEVSAGHAVQLLTHPIWWTGPRASPQDRLEKFLRRRQRVLNQELAKNCDVYRPEDYVAEGSIQIQTKGSPTERES